MAKGVKVIKVFRCPQGRGEYRKLYNHIKESGWTVLGVRPHLLCDDFLIRCVRSDYFMAQSYERQVQIAKGEKRSNY
jgi:hypothetical protein